MGFLDKQCDMLRNKQSAVIPLTGEKIKNHFMKGKQERTSYIRLLQFVLYLLKPCAANLEAGNRFVECIHRSVEESASLDELMTQVLECEEKDLRQWIKEVLSCGGSGVLALDALLLRQRVEAGEEGLVSLSNFFTMAAIDQNVVKDAAEAAKLISGKDEKGVLLKDWHILSPESLKGYFSSWNPDEQMQLDVAVSLFMRDRVTEAYPLFLKLAKRGNRRAMYYMGEYYRFGWAGLPVNKGLGFHYHHLGAEKGEPLCQLNLAYEYGPDEGKILQETIPKVMKLAQAGDIAAEYELGNNIEDWDQSEFWLEKAAKNGYWSPVWGLAERYGVDAPEKAITWLEIVYQMHGDHAGEAANNIGNFCYHRENHAEALKWYMNGATCGYDWCMRNLGMCYKCGYGVSIDYEKARKWLQKAIDCHGTAEEDARKKLNEL